MMSKREWNMQAKSTFTSEPITPKLVSLKYSNGFVLHVVLRNGNRYEGSWAAKEHGTKQAVDYSLHKKI